MPKALKIFLIAAAITLAAILLLLGAYLLIKNKEVPENITESTISQNVAALKIDVNSAKISILKGKQIEVKTNIKELSISDDNEILQILEDNPIEINNTESFVELYIPSDCQFEKIELIAEAGNITAQKLSTANLSVELDAGALLIDELFVSQSANVTVGTSNLKILGGEIKDLNLNVGVGQVEIKASLLGESDLELGVGATALELNGGPEDYLVQFSHGIGTVSVNDKPLQRGDSYGSGLNKIIISGGAGSATIKIKK